MIKLLMEFTYDNFGQRCRKHEVLNPTWEQMEDAVRRLDKFQFPIVWFFTTEDVSDDEIPDFEIMGGETDYYISVSAHGYKQRRYFDATKARTRIDVWTSDQGCSIEACHAIHEIDLVLAALKYFSETGGFSPKLSWE